jgi:alpha-ribazole phosphatase
MNHMSSQDCLRLYLIRHGEVEGIADGQLFGRTDRPLSEHGVAQAHQLAELLSTAHLSAVYCSDLQRAKMTAEIIARPTRLKVQVDSAWREIDMGDWEGRTVSALHNEAPQLVESLFTDPDSFKYPEGESFAAFTARVQSALDQLLMSHNGEQLALIAHGGVCRAIIGTALEIPMKNWLRLSQDYGCVNVIDWYDRNPTVRFLNHVYSSPGALPY